MALFFEINEARKVLELEEAAGKRDIEPAYQRMSLKFKDRSHASRGNAVGGRLGIVPTLGVGTQRRDVSRP